MDDKSREHKHGEERKQGISSGERGQGSGDPFNRRRHQSGQLQSGNQHQPEGPEGNWQERTEWHYIVAYDRLADIVEKYVKKGHKLYIEGRLTTRNWDDKEHAGIKHYRTEIVVSDLSLLSAREDGGAGAGGYSRQSGASGNFDQRPPAGQD